MKKKKIVVTTSWDDGHKLDLRVYYLLRKYGLKGTFYVAPKDREFSESELLSDKEIIQISKDFEIGAHTMTHSLLTNNFTAIFYELCVKCLKVLKGEKYKVSPILSTIQAEKEIADSKKYLQDLLKKEVVSFCYPAGRYNLKIQNLVKKEGFKYARTVDEYEFVPSKNVFASGTTIHAYKRYKDVFTRMRFLNWNLKEFFKNFSWDGLAKKMFDYVLENGGVYHLWGHSWLIDESGDWRKLEKVLSYISGRKDVLYVENKDLVNV